MRKSSLQVGLPKGTKSLCPECNRSLDAIIYDESGKVMIEKECQEHGKFKDTYWSNTEMYLRAEKYAYDGQGVKNPRTEASGECPTNCGLCPDHLSYTALGLIDLTNRCNLRCPVCFANANEAGYVYEPEFPQVVDMLENLSANRPVPRPAVQFSGGESTIYRSNGYDLTDVIKKAKELGFAQILIATNGLKLTKQSYAQELVDAGLNTAYLQFDSFDREAIKNIRGRDLLDEKLKVIEVCRNTSPKLSVVLVPTIVNTVNDEQVGKILKYAIENSDVVRAVNYQPVSFTGRIDSEELIKLRFTLPDLVDRLKTQTGIISESDMYPVPCVSSIFRFASVLTGEEKVNFTCHPHCGIATFLYVEDGNAVPITRFIDVDGLFKELDEVTEKTKGKRLSASQKLSSLKFTKYIDKKKAPKSFKLKYLKDMFTRGDKEGPRPLTWRTVMVGGMHFQDSYNYDIERVKRCVIHYATPDGRIIPFCSYNGGPTYRQEVEQKFSTPLEEWKKGKR